MVKIHPSKGLSERRFCHELFIRLYAGERGLVLFASAKPICAAVIRSEGFVEWQS